MGCLVAAQERIFTLGDPVTAAAQVRVSQQHGLKRLLTSHLSRRLRRPAAGWRNCFHLLIFWIVPFWGTCQPTTWSTTDINAMRTSIRLLNIILMIAASLLQVQTGQAEELSRGAMLSASCEGCHGTHGRSPGAIPSIAGKSAEYLRDALEGFRSGDRQATVMGRHVKGYSEEEIRLISEYFSKQQ